MLVMKKCGFHILSVSVAGASAHNIAQLFAASILLGSAKILGYSACLFPVGILTGALLGLLAALILPRLKMIVRM